MHKNQVLPEFAFIPIHMNKKIVFLIVLLCGIATAIVYAYQKYERFIPATNLNTPVTILSDQEIKKIRQQTPITEVQVYKTKRLVNLLHQNQVIRTYPMRLGFDPIGHKVKEGDGKTPEGRYLIDWRNPKSAFYKSLHISYPNEQDKLKAKQLGLSAGGDIMIHGSATTQQVQKLPQLMDYMPRNDWTWGCVAVRNVDMDEIWKLVDDRIPITIYK